MLKEEMWPDHPAALRMLLPRLPAVPMSALPTAQVVNSASAPPQGGRVAEAAHRSVEGISAPRDPLPSSMPMETKIQGDRRGCHPLMLFGLELRCCCCCYRTVRACPDRPGSRACTLACTRAGSMQQRPPAEAAAAVAGRCLQSDPKKRARGCPTDRRHSSVTSPPPLLPPSQSLADLTS